MATEKRLIDANELVDAICRSDEALHSTQWETDESTMYCKPVRVGMKILTGSSLWMVIVPTEKGKTMDEMMFPYNWEGFLGDYSFIDHKEFYTNGARLIPTFRVEQLVEHYFAPDNNVGHKWIPVSERLPEEDGRYLVYKVFGDHGWHDVHGFAKDGRKVDEYDFQKRWKDVWFNYDSEYGYITYDSVTHWMPLPEPPKEENNEA